MPLLSIRAYLEAFRQGARDQVPQSLSWTLGSSALCLVREVLLLVALVGVGSSWTLVRLWVRRVLLQGGLAPSAHTGTSALKAFKDPPPPQSVLGHHISQGGWEMTRPSVGREGALRGSPRTGAKLIPGLHPPTSLLAARHR